MIIIGSSIIIIRTSSIKARRADMIVCFKIIIDEFCFILTNRTIMVVNSYNLYSYRPIWAKGNPFILPMTVMAPLTTFSKTYGLITPPAQTPNYIEMFNVYILSSFGFVANCIAFHFWFRKIFSNVSISFVQMSVAASRGVTDLSTPIFSAEFEWWSWLSWL